MSDVTDSRQPAHRTAAPAPEPGGGTPPRPYLGTPNAERYVIAADNLRRRQLKSALLHGSSRTWREQRRIWPGVIAGVVAVALIVAAIAVVGAFRTERELQRQRQGSRPPPVAASHPRAGVRPLPDWITPATVISLEFT
jgi:hypothetical protein